MAIGRADAPVWAREDARGARSHPQRRHRLRPRAVSGVGTLSAAFALRRGARPGCSRPDRYDRAPKFHFPRRRSPMSLGSRRSSLPQSRRRAAHCALPEGLWIKCPAAMRFCIAPTGDATCMMCPKCSITCAWGRATAVSASRPGHERGIGAAISPEDPLSSATATLPRPARPGAESDGESMPWWAGRQLHALRSSPAPSNSSFSRLDGLGGRRALQARVDYCIQERRPFVCFSASGGAAMQERLYSLFQMAKTAAALSRLAQAHLAFISVRPITTAAFASLRCSVTSYSPSRRALIGSQVPGSFSKRCARRCRRASSAANSCSSTGPSTDCRPPRDARPDRSAPAALLKLPPPPLPDARALPKPV